MRVLSIEEQMIAFLLAGRARMAIRDAKPCDPEALAAISRVMTLVAPPLAEMNEWEAQRGLPLTEVRARTERAAAALTGSARIIVFAPTACDGE